MKFCLSVILVLSPAPPVAPGTSTQRFVYCYGAAILLRAESGGEVIAWLAYGNPPSSIHPFFIIQCYLSQAAKLFIRIFFLSLFYLKLAATLSLFARCCNLEFQILYRTLKTYSYVSRMNIKSLRGHRFFAIPDTYSCLGV